MSTPLLSNFARSVLDEPIGLADTTLFIAVEDAQNLPVPGADEYFPLTLVDGVNAPEIVYCTVNNLGELTVTRAEEGTAARAWDAGTQVRHGLTAGIFQYFYDIATVFLGTSATSHDLVLGEKTFVTQANKLFPAGQFVLIQSRADPTHDYMGGQVIGYAGTSLVVDVTQVSGNGVHTDWNIMISGPTGVAGEAGAIGADGAAGAPGNDGAAGTAGRTILSGAGAPGGGTGADGDFYVDLTNKVFYGPKAAGAWGAGFSMVGTGAILATVVTTEGDIIVRDSAAPARLARGTTGQVLRSTATTVAWGALDLAAAAAVTGALPLTKGGTGATSAAAALAALLGAPLASPPLTGNPTAPTQTAGNNSTRLATTAFVQAAVAAAGGGDMLGSNNLSEITSLSTSRSNLGLGSMATVNSPVPIANGGTAGTTAAAARTNLGLGTMATVTIPTSSAIGIGIPMFCIYLNSSSVANGATTPGNNLQLAIVNSAGVTVAGGATQSGTWMNISGTSQSNSSIRGGYWIKTVA